MARTAGRHTGSNRSLRGTVPFPILALCLAAAPTAAQDCAPGAYYAATAVQCAFGPGDPAAPYSLTPVPDVPGPLAEAVRFRRLELPEASAMVMHYLHDRFRDPERVARMTADGFAVLPPPVLRALPRHLVFAWERQFSGLDAEADPDILLSFLRFDPSLVVEGEGRLAHAFEELLLHEIAHLLDVLGGGVSSRPGWAAAVARDSGSASGYAETDASEDFAEAFTAWAAYKRDLSRPASARRMSPAQIRGIRNHIRYRMGWLDRELLDAATKPHGRLFLR